MIAAGGSFGGFDLQESIRVHQQQQQQQMQQCNLSTLHQKPRENRSAACPSTSENFYVMIGNMDDCAHSNSSSFANSGKGERGKSSGSDEDEPSFTKHASGGRNDVNSGTTFSQWHRIKWTDEMVRFLITAVSYIGEGATLEYGSVACRKYLSLQKGKWKSISKVMAERGHFVSPQQCEDKFNDLNKRYKRLNEILGRGTSCDVVENPRLLDRMDHISEKEKEEVRKILSSKHLHYEEMCSYHNKNRLHLPPDPELQRSLILAKKTRNDDESSDARWNLHDDSNDDDRETDVEDQDEFEHHTRAFDCLGVHGMAEASAKRMKRCQGHGSVRYGNFVQPVDCNRTFSSPQLAKADLNQSLCMGTKANSSLEQWIKNRSLLLEEQKLKIQEQMLDLENERFKWQWICKKRDQELEAMRMRNERMRLENEHMALELKQKVMAANIN